MAHKGIRGERYRRLIDRAKACGWTIRYDGKGHIRATSPDGRWFTVSGTMEDKDPHAWQNVRRAARIAGLEVRDL